MFSRGLFKFYLKIVSYPKVRNLSKFLKWFNEVIAIEQMQVKKDMNEMSPEYKLLPLYSINIYSKWYNLRNEDSINLINFRKKNLPMINNWFTKVIRNHYSGGFHEYDLFNNFYFFLENSSSANILKKNFNCKNKILNVFMLLKFLGSFDHFFSKYFYKTNNNDNLVKIYFVLYRLYCKNEFDNEVTVQDLNKCESWFKFSQVVYFNKENQIWLEDESLEEPLERVFTEVDWDEIEDKIIYKDYTNYVELYSEVCWNYFNKVTYKLINNVFRVQINLNNLKHIYFETNFLNNLKSYFPTRYADSSVNKFINLSKIDNFIVYHLRKIKIFNKGRYSRNRQTYRTGFYWCLWLNIFVVYGLQFVFYRYMFTFGYLWIFLFIFFGSFVFSRALKYNLISWNYIWTEKIEFFKFLKFIFVNFYVVFKKTIYVFYKNMVSLLNGLERENVVWLESDFDVDQFHFTNQQWFFDLRNWFNDKLNDYFHDSILENLEADIQLFDEDLEKKKLSQLSELEFKDKIRNPIWVTDFHEISSDIYQKIMIMHHKRMMDKFKNN
jgi:hypothetical protein